MKHLLYIRHGETEFNEQRKWSGRTDTKLTEKGIRQAHEAGEKLAKKQVTIDLIICSPLTRSLRSAHIIADEIGYPSSEIETRGEITERSYGVLEGMLRANFWGNHTYRDLDDVEGGESVEAVEIRAANFLAYLKMLDAYETILVVGHGAFGRALVRVVKGLPYTEEYDNEKRDKLMMANGEAEELL